MYVERLRPARLLPADWRRTRERRPDHADRQSLIELDAEGQRNRLRAVWLSRRDCAELIARCLDVEDVSWAVVYGVSSEPAPVLGSDHARELLGWEPEDSAAI